MLLSGGPTNIRMIIMSEKIQRNAAAMGDTMSHRFPDGRRHKHNTYHLIYRRNEPSSNPFTNEWEQMSNIGKNNIKKTRLRIVKHRIH